ncbi:fumarylacetoacetate hydrolase family protein [Sphingobium sp. HWE2-09]|uniref:fumarylacetoacetate hydrolase family protein n=1 Tax=Sphingobium sp. HWE2-09 TaxID=3108390 RepID=UPI002DD3ABCA|nr:fumarylacetoacetate hydrolase family protein [Sphingobium sp. HWE2-09]
MKLASLKSGRDGRLVVVTRDLSRCTAVDDIAPTMQAALDNWEELSPQLSSVAADLESGVVTGQPFDQGACMSPLPRAYQWADASAYVNHVALVRQARGAEMPPSFYHDPIMYQGGSDCNVAPHDPILVGDEAWGYDFEAEIAVVTGDVPQGVSAAEAEQYIRLFMLCNDVSLRNLIPPELAKGFGFFHGKPPTTYSPVAVTKDELGDTWRDGRLHLPLLVSLNGQPFGKAEAGEDATFSHADLIAHAAKTRPLSAGTIIGAGTVSNRDAEGGPGQPISEGGSGYSCIAEIRVVETILHGAPSTPFMQIGDRVEIEMVDATGRSIFGRIDQATRQIS